MLLLRRIVRVLLQPSDLFRAEFADHGIGKLVVIPVGCHLIVQIINVIFQKIDGKRIPDAAAGKAVGDLPVILMINEQKTVRINAVAAAACQAVEKADWESVKKVFIYAHGVFLPYIYLYLIIYSILGKWQGWDCLVCDSGYFKETFPPLFNVLTNCITHSLSFAMLPFSSVPGFIPIPISRMQVGETGTQ